MVHTRNETEKHPSVFLMYVLINSFAEYRWIFNENNRLIRPRTKYVYIKLPFYAFAHSMSIMLVENITNYMVFHTQKIFFNTLMG